MNQRSCGECTRCCEGWLKASINGKRMCAGKPCHYLGKSCTIYEDRPDDPCREYTCEWLDNPDLPEWMKPNLSNVIITRKTTPDDKLTYCEVVETGRLIESTTLNWIIHWALQNKVNIVYEVQGQMYKLGNAEFTTRIDKY